MKWGWASLFLLISVLVTSNTVGAVSQYDGSFIDKSSASIELTSHNNSTGINGEFIVSGLSLGQVAQHLKDCSDSVYYSFSDSALNNKDYLVYTYATYKDRVSFIWGEKNVSQINYTDSYSSPRFIINSTGTVNKYDVIATPEGWSCQSTNFYDGYVFGDPATPSWIYMNGISANYPDGYSGLILPNTYQFNPVTPLYPDFRYTIDINKNLNVKYSNDVPEIPYSSSDNLHKFVYTLIPSDDHYTNYVYEDKIDEKELNVTKSYDYQFTDDGYYVLMINFKTIIPGSNIEGVQTMTINLHIETGKFVSGDTNVDSCTNSICSPPNTNCGARDGFLNVFMCQYNAQLSIGILNPTINALKDLFSSMFVSTTPICELSMPDAPLPGGRVFSSSGLSTSICSTSDKIKNAFPLLSSISNLAFSFMTMVLIFKIVNRLSDLNNNNIIEGL